MRLGNDTRSQPAERVRSGPPPPQCNLSLRRLRSCNALAREFWYSHFVESQSQLCSCKLQAKDNGSLVRNERSVLICMLVSLQSHQLTLKVWRSL
jgi:hypothetical protein